MQAQYERDQVEKEAMRDVAQEAFQKMKNVLQENKQLKRLISKFNSEKTKFEKSNSEKSALNSTLIRRAPAILSFLMARTPSETIKAGLDQEQPSENSPLHPSTEDDLKEPLVENFNIVKYPNECIAKDGNLKQVEISLQSTDDKPGDIRLHVDIINNEMIVDAIPIADEECSVENLPANDDDDGSYNPFDAQEHIGCDEELSVSESLHSSDDETCEFDFQSSVSHRVMELSMNMSLRDSYTWEGSSLTSSLSSASARLSRMSNIGASLLSEHCHGLAGLELNEEDEETEDEDEIDHQIEQDGKTDQTVSPEEAFESSPEDIVSDEEQPNQYILGEGQGIDLEDNLNSRSSSCESSVVEEDNVISNHEFTPRILSGRAFFHFRGKATSDPIPDRTRKPFFGLGGGKRTESNEDAVTEQKNNNRPKFARFGPRWQSSPN